MMLDIRVTVNTSAPYPDSLVLTYVLAPFTSVMTMMTEATPMTTPMSVRMLRSLLLHRDCRASLKASVNCMVWLSWPWPPSVRRAVEVDFLSPGASLGSWPVPQVYAISRGSNSRMPLFMDGAGSVQAAHPVRGAGLSGTCPAFWGWFVLF